MSADGGLRNRWIGTPLGNPTTTRNFNSAASPAFSMASDEEVCTRIRRLIRENSTFEHAMRHTAHLLRPWRAYKVQAIRARGNDSSLYNDLSWWQIEHSINKNDTVYRSTKSV